MHSTARPNVILFLADDLGYGDLGCHGNPIVKTAHLDAFAKESVEWDRFYVSPVCSPTRASILTGRYNFRTGVTDVPPAACRMDPAEITLAQRLKAAGYATGLFGKWHLGDEGPHRPTMRGFDEVLTFFGGVMKRDHYFDPTLIHNDQPEKYAGYCMDIFTDAAIAFIQQHRQNPFFLFLPANLIHAPMIAPDDLVAHYDNLGLLDSTHVAYGMIESLDRNFGRLAAALAEAGVADNTLLIALSDNGPCSASDPRDRHMAGLHGLKGTVYENGIRVPCFMRWPAGFAGGSTQQPIAAHIDLMPTILDACGVSEDAGNAMDGRSLLPLLRDPAAASSQRTILFQWDSGIVPRRGSAYCVLNQQWKLVQPCGMDHVNQQHIRDRYRELCMLQGRGERSMEGPARYELYDIGADPGEHRDLAGDHPAIVRDMRAVYDAWFTDVAARWNA